MMLVALNLDTKYDSVCDMQVSTDTFFISALNTSQNVKCLCRSIVYVSLFPLEI